MTKAKLANLLALDADDAAFLTRLVGPRIPEEMMTFMVDAKAVDFDNLADLKIVVSALVSSIVHAGIKGTPGGWRLYKRDGRFCLAVCRIALPEEQAA